jgi:hypothetical protein
MEVFAGKQMAGSKRVDGVWLATAFGGAQLVPSFLSASSAAGACELAKLAGQVWSWRRERMAGTRADVNCRDFAGALAALDQTRTRTRGP